ncbi:MAG: PAS domain S-box protein [Marinilabiliales bacterium]|nr:PAS domain S-box protein [Marinilabiliales bacterium]
MISLLSGGFFQRILSGNAFARYKEVFDQAGFAIMLIDNKTNRFIKVNRAASELFGYTVEELQKMTPLDLSTEPEEDRRMLGEKPENAIVRPSRRKDGKIIIIKILTRHSRPLSCEPRKRCHRGVPHPSCTGDERATYQ